MSTRPTRPFFSDRLRLLRELLVPALVVGLLLRIVLYSSFRDGAFSAAELGGALATGLVLDLASTLLLLAPLVLALATLRLAPLRRTSVRVTLLTALYALTLFDACAEYFFFEEFNARYNHIAFDYLVYPTEVFTNLRESYDLPLVLGTCLLSGAALAWAAARRTSAVEFGPLPFAARWRGGITALAGLAVSLGLACAIPCEVSVNRVTSEVAQNGLVQLVRAFVTADLDYTLYYETLPAPEARARAARRLGFDPPTADQLAAPAASFSLQRSLEPLGQAAVRPDVVLLVEESLGSNFVGALGAGDGGETPRLDEWSRRGLLLTNLVANGNRTVRGLEGVLCSFVPLPGDSLVKKPAATNVATLARVFCANDYDTCFLYGGRGVFDHMKPFMTQNGWQEFVEQPDYPDDAFTTAWGVADETIFDALLARQERARGEGKRLFATLMSVSNHRPYDVPPGRSAGPRSRQSAVRYADWALGRYLDQASERGLLEHTIVLVVGDHGARVYGSEEIPVASYRIPALFLAPAGTWPAPLAAGQTLDRLCSQVDLAPTLLSLAGIACRVPFLGQDLLALPEGAGRAFVHHNNDLGLLTDDALVVLQLRKQSTFYRRPDRTSDDLVRLSQEEVTPELRELERDAAAVFQTAYELFESGNYALPATGVSSARTAGTTTLARLAR